MPLSHVAVAPELCRLEERLEANGQLAGRQPRDVLLIEPVQLLWIEHRVAAADSPQRELRHQFVPREDLAVRAW